MEKNPKKVKKPGSAGVASPRGQAAVPAARIGRRNILLFVAGLGAVVLGYLILSMGGESLATLLLVGGYLVLVPYAILAGGRGSSAAQRPPDRVAGE